MLDADPFFLLQSALLSQFASRSISAAVPVSQVDMEVDSTASTPGGA